MYRLVGTSYTYIHKNSKLCQILKVCIPHIKVDAFYALCYCQHFYPHFILYETHQHFHAHTCRNIINVELTQ